MVYRETESRSAIVYQAVNRIDGNVYIGITCRSLRQRKWEHAHDAKSCRDRSRFHYAIRRHGFDNFTFSIIATVGSFQEACAKERELIASMNPPYNLTKGGEGFLGRVVSEAERANMSARAKGRLGTMTGRKHSAEVRAVMSEKAKARTPKAPHHAAALRKGQQRSAERHRKPVICLTDGQRFVSATAASLHYGWAAYAVANAIGKTKGRMRGHEFCYEQVR